MEYTNVPPRRPLPRLCTPSPFGSSGQISSGNSSCEESKSLLAPSSNNPARPNKRSSSSVDFLARRTLAQSLPVFSGVMSMQSLSLQSPIPQTPRTKSPSSPMEALLLSSPEIMRKSPGPSPSRPSPAWSAHSSFSKYSLVNEEKCPGTITSAQIVDVSSSPCKTFARLNSLMFSIEEYSSSSDNEEVSFLTTLQDKARFSKKKKVMSTVCSSSRRKHRDFGSPPLLSPPKKKKSYQKRFPKISSIDKISLAPRKTSQRRRAIIGKSPFASLRVPEVLLSSVGCTISHDNDNRCFAVVSAQEECIHSGDHLNYLSNHLHLENSATDINLGPTFLEVSGYLSEEGSDEDFILATPMELANNL